MITLTNGYVQNAGGLIVPNGSIQMQLNVDATVIAAPGGIVCSDIPVLFQFDANGLIQSGAKIWSNAELNPQNSIGLGTYYEVTFFDANGGRINQVPMWWQFTEAAGSTVDISQMTAFSVVGGNVIYYPTSFAIPAPSPTSLGGVFSNIGATHQWISAINTDGTVVLSQPSFADISGTISASQMPNPLVFSSITASGLITAQANIQLGLTGTLSGQITMEGSTSGAATITAPAVAGTTTNAITVSNSLQIPSGGVFAISSDTGLSRDSAGVIDLGNGAAGNKSGSLKLTGITATGTITAASLTGLTGSITPNAAGGIAVGSAALPFSSIFIGGAATNNAQITGTFTAARVWTIPDVTDTATGIAAAQTLTNKTLTSPVVNGTPTGTGIPTAKGVHGSGAGNYTSTSTAYANVDATNLTYTVTVPTGWKLMCWATADVGVATSAVAVFIAINDSVGGVLVESQITPNAVIANSVHTSAIMDVVTGDGLSHTITLQFKTSNASDAVTLINTSATLTPHMTFLLIPSN